MAGFITAEGLVVAAGADTYDYVNDQRRLSASIRSVVPVTDSTGAATVTAAMNTDGRPVSATNPLISWDQALKKIVVYDGTTSYGVGQHAEFTGSISNTANALWGPGPLTLDSANSLNPGFATSPSNDRIALAAGEYAVSCRYSMAASATGTSWGAIVNDGNTVTWTSSDITAGYSTIMVAMPVLYLPTAQNVRFTFISGTGTTITTRVRVTRLG